ncbi:MAG: hypothetical protein NTW21_38780 [Verrucomicrobia bacterium]|nr:hypothetical protein [Verrucomicrobiota bacterium]
MVARKYGSRVVGWLTVPAPGGKGHGTVAMIGLGVGRVLDLGCRMLGGGDLRIEHSTFNIQHSTFNIQYSIFNIQHSTFNIQHSTFNIQYSNFKYKNRRCGDGSWSFQV